MLKYEIDIKCNPGSMLWFPYNIDYLANKRQLCMKDNKFNDSE